MSAAAITSRVSRLVAFAAGSRSTATSSTISSGTVRIQSA
jgi:hypothetical protein